MVILGLAICTVSVYVEGSRSATGIRCTGLLVVPWTLVALRLYTFISVLRSWLKGLDRNKKAFCTSDVQLLNSPGFRFFLFSLNIIRITVL